MKRAAGINRNNTLQNLSSLLMRLGRFAPALPIVREQAEVAEQTHDVDLAADAKAKLAELVPAASDSQTARAPGANQGDVDHTTSERHDGS